jgi:hypothetical protein
MNMQEYINSINDIVEKGKSFNIKFYIIDQDIERRVEAALQFIFLKCRKPDMAGIVYTCVKELMINGAKANLKRVLFETSNLDMDDEDTYIEGMMQFKNLLIEGSYRNFLHSLKERDYWIAVKFNFNPDGVRIEVVNNAHITRLEDKRLREKLSKAVQYEDIVQFYIEQGDELEGAGMGIALIVMLLKGIQIDPSYFRIGNTDQGQTFSRIEIPISPNYVSIRNIHNKK